jgi:putative endonuclease
VARPDSRRSLGAVGEDAVAAWYRSRGYDVVDRNWRCRDGELDLVVARSGLIVFCEVKTRRSERFGAPFEAVTATKQRRLRGLAARWLAEHPHASARVRFDVASVYARADCTAHVEVLERAF